MNSLDDVVDPSAFDIRLLDSRDFVTWQPPNVSSVQNVQAASDDDLAACFEEARQRGLNEGRAQGEAEFRKRNEQLAAIIASLGKPLSDLDTAVERELSELAVLIGQQLFRQQLKVEPQQILHIVHDCISRLPLGNSPIRIAVHPDDAALIAGSGEMEPSWQLIEDPSMARGGCEIVNDSSRIDASIETRLAELIEQLFGEHYNAPTSPGL